MNAQKSIISSKVWVNIWNNDKKIITLQLVHFNPFHSTIKYIIMFDVLLEHVRFHSTPLIMTAVKTQ